MNKYEELLEQETKRLEAKESVARKKVETKKEVIIDFLTKLNPFLEYLNGTFVYKYHCGNSGSLCKIIEFPIEYADYGGEGLNAEFTLEKFIKKSGDMNYRVSFSILGSKIEIKCDNDFKLNITWGWDYDNDCVRVIETPSDIEGVAIKIVASLLKKEEKIEGKGYEGRGYFKFNKK